MIDDSNAEAGEEGVSISLVLEIIISIIDSINIGNRSYVLELCSGSYSRVL